MTKLHAIPFAYLLLSSCIQKYEYLISVDAQGVRGVLTVINKDWKPE